MLLSALLTMGLAALTDVAILQHRFEPDSVRIQPGDTVRWTHQDATAHTVTGNGIEVWDSGYMAFGDVYVKVFPKTGAYDYVCLYHPMFARVFVGAATAILPAKGSKPAAQAGRAEDGSLRDVRGRSVDLENPWGRLVPDKMSPP